LAAFRRYDVHLAQEHKTMNLAEYNSLSPEAFCTRVGGARREGSEWFCYCPVHGDESTAKSNLHVSTGTKQHLIFHCVTRQCPSKDILKALQYRGLYPEKPAASKRAKAKGAEEKENWTPIVPVPDDAPRPTEELKGGTAYTYRDAEGHLLAYIKRVQKGSEKAPYPLTYCEHKGTKERAWQWIGMEKPTPLYGLDRLAAHPHLPVLIVEGEKCAEVEVEGYVLVSWMGGAGRVGNVDWKPVEGRDLTMWPDADKDGLTAQTKLVELLKSDVKLVRVDDLPNKFDIADAAAGAPTGKFGTEALPAWPPEKILERIKAAVVGIDPLAPALPDDDAREKWRQTSADMEFRQDGAFTEYRPRTRAGESDPYADKIYWHKSEKVAVQIANFRARIERERIYDSGNDSDDGNLPRRYEVVCYQGGKEVRGMVPAEHFRDSGWVERIVGAGGIVPSQDFPKLTEAIKRFSLGTTTTERVYRHTGWRKINEELFYLHGGGAVGAKGLRTDLRVELPLKLSSFTLLEPFDPADVQPAIERSMAFARLYPRATVPVWCAIWRSMIARMPHAISLAADSGAFKSQIAILVMQHFGVGFDHDSKLPLKWEDTPASMEITLNACVFAPCVVDNYRPGEMEGTVRNQYVLKGDRILSAMANGASLKERGVWLGKEGLEEAPSLPSRATPISTAEEPPGLGSTQERAMATRIDKPEILKRKGTLREIQIDSCAGMFCRLTTTFIKWLAHVNDENGLTTLELLQGRLPKLREDLALAVEARADFAHPRAKYLVADTYTGFAYFKMFAKTYGVEIPTDFEQLVKDTLIDLVQGRQIDQRVEKPHRKFLGHLQDALASGKVHLTSMDGTQPQEPLKYGWRERPQGARFTNDEMEDAPIVYEPAPGSVHAGYLDPGGTTYWLPDITFQTIRKLIGDIGIKDAMELWRRLMEDKLLALTTRQTRTGKDDRQYVCEYPLFQKKRLAVPGWSAVLCLKAQLFGEESEIEPVVMQYSVEAAVNELEGLIELEQRIAAEAPAEYSTEEPTYLARLQDWLNGLKVGDVENVRHEQREYFDKLMKSQGSAIRWADLKPVGLVEPE
jgi:hypothetical protein